jgi:hypothetical protein
VVTLTQAAAQQSLAADGAIARFSSNLVPFSLNGDRAPQLKAIVGLLSHYLYFMTRNAKRFVILALLIAIALSVVSGCTSERNQMSKDVATPVPSATNDSRGQAKPLEFVGLVSPVQVVANPTMFDGKRLQVLGFMHLEFEGNGIYISREDHEYGMDKNGLWLEIPKSDPLHCKEVNDSYVIIDGVFNATHRGHEGFFSGAIENITLCKRWAKVKTQR